MIASGRLQIRSPSRATAGLQQLTDLVGLFIDQEIEVQNGWVFAECIRIRPLALYRKNALFAGSDEGGDNWAVIDTLIENCKLSGINPKTWLTQTLEKLANGHLPNSVDELMPWTAVA